MQKYTGCLAALAAAAVLLYTGHWQSSACDFRIYLPESHRFLPGYCDSYSDQGARMLIAAEEKDSKDSNNGKKDEKEGKEGKSEEDGKLKELWDAPMLG
jgi:hypothetical protein